MEWKFQLPAEDITKLFTEAELDDQIVVVSFFGKSTFNREGPLSYCYGDPENVCNSNQDEEDNEDCTIHGYYMPEEKVLRLYLIGPFNPLKLLKSLGKYSKELEEKGFLHCWNKVKCYYGRALLFLFSLSHIVINVNPSETPDFAIMQLLKLLSFVRPSYQTVFNSAIADIGCDDGFFMDSDMHQDILSHGRLCSPRLLFIFECPLDIQMEEDLTEKSARTMKLEHAIEDQIYFALRKCRLVKNVCQKAFFSIAPNDEFVYLQSSHHYTVVDMIYQSLMKSLDNNEKQIAESKADLPLLDLYVHPDMGDDDYLDDPDIHWIWKKKPGWRNQKTAPEPPTKKPPVKQVEESPKVEEESSKTISSTLSSPSPVVPSPINTENTWSPNTLAASFSNINIQGVPYESDEDFELDNSRTYEPFLGQSSMMYAQAIGEMYPDFTAWNPSAQGQPNDGYYESCLAPESIDEYYLAETYMTPNLSGNLVNTFPPSNLCQNMSNHFPTQDLSHDLWTYSRISNEPQQYMDEGLNEYGISNMTLQFIENDTSSSTSISSSSSSLMSYCGDENGTQNYKPDVRFNSFLQKHVHQAQTDGFHDNMGKYTNMKPFFIRPNLRSWLSMAQALSSKSNFGNRGPNNDGDFGSLIGTELQFSSARCKKIIPLAIAHYQENLPPHYNNEVHKKQLKRAIDTFKYHARGPGQEKYIQELKSQCDSIWKSGRQTCEVLSLFKNSCTWPSHQCSGNKSDKDDDHWSVVQFISSCNCGMKQGNRPDPFTLKAANYLFYRDIGKECGCIHLEKYNFPVFQPSIQDYKAADVQLFGINQEYYGNSGNTLANLYQERNSNSAQTLFSVGNLSKIWTSDDSYLTINEGSPKTPLSDQSGSIILDYINPHNQEKQLIRQASTTEYLPGMLHLESPHGLLPQFPSWSLVCRGPSSLYSHNLGLHDQPGYILGSSFLLPWDVTIKEKEGYSTFSPDPKKLQNTISFSRGNYKKFQRLSRDYINVKIFIGVEYECLRGHRFMSSAPGKILQVTANGTVKENANKITKGNMPLYLPCPCSKSLAQLMRIHIVTPKAPVHVTIDPKVRPAPVPCPVFVTGEQKPIALTQSTYWVLRLPFIYSCEFNIYSTPTRMKKAKYGELLGPMYGITQIIE